MVRKKVSKSRRIKDYLENSPEATTKEITEALGSYGVNYGDVTSVRNSLKKAAARQSGDSSSPAITQKRRGRPPKNLVPKSLKDLPPQSGVPAYRAGLEFVSACGGFDQASQILGVIREIREFQTTA